MTLERMQLCISAEGDNYEHLLKLNTKTSVYMSKVF